MVFVTAMIDNFWDIFVQETNRYAAHFLEVTVLKPKSGNRVWKEEDASEMKAFIMLLEWWIKQSLRTTGSTSGLLKHRNPTLLCPEINSSLF